MFRKFLIGPALLGAGYAGGSYYGADAEQLVHKTPDEVRDAVEELADRSGTMKSRRRQAGAVRDEGRPRR